MAIDIALDNGDLIPNGFGDISLEFTDEDDIVQMANSAINTIKGENIFHLEYGNNAWNQRLKQSESGYNIVAACSKDAILHADNRIIEVIDISASKGDGYGECIVTYVLRTIDGRKISSSTNINIL